MAGLAVGLAPLEWTWSTIAGVRSLAVLFVAALLLAAFSWQRKQRDQRPSPGKGLRSDSGFLLLAFLAGVALDHHRTVVFLFPFLAMFVLLVNWKVVLQPALLAKGAALFLAPLLLYGVLPLRAAHGAPWDQENSGTLPGFLQLVLVPDVSGAHLNLTLPQVLARGPMLWRETSSEFTIPLLVLMVLGLFWLVRNEPRVLLMLAGFTLVIAWFTLQWNIGYELNAVYFMAAYVPLALLAASGAAQVERLAGRRKPERQAIGAACIAVVAVAGLVVDRGKFQPPEVLDNIRQELFAGHQARRLADAMKTLPANATIVCDWDQATVFWYAQFIDGINRSVAISYPTATLPATLAEARGPVFLATAAVQPETSNLTAAGPFVEVMRAPTTQLPDGLVPAGGSFGDEIQLAGVGPISSPGFGVLPVTLYFRALKAPAADYSISVRLMSSPDKVAAQNDQGSPVLGLSPTSHWVTGQVTADYHELDIRDLPDGSYDLAVVLYQALPGGKFRNLPYGGSDRAVLGQVTISGGAVRFSAS